MILVTYWHEGDLRLGLVVGQDQVLDVTAAWGEDPDATGTPPRDVGELCRRGDEGLAFLTRLATKGASARGSKPLSSVRIAAPIPRPLKNVFCVGRNYSEHIAEGNRAQGKPPAPPPPFPEFFTKGPGTVIAAGEGIPVHSRSTEQLDYEVELAVIIGREGSDIPRERALEYVFGYSIINDITGRDLQRRHGQWFKGKSLDRSCPFGPVVVHKSALPNVGDLAIRLSVNGEPRQGSRTSKMIFDLPTIIEQLSRGMTLEAGDVIATGTPSGVGYAMTPPRFLAAGDVIRAEIEGIGVLENQVVDQ